MFGIKLCQTIRWPDNVVEKREILLVSHMSKTRANNLLQKLKGSVGRGCGRIYDLDYEWENDYEVIEHDGVANCLLLEDDTRVDP